MHASEEAQLNLERATGPLRAAFNAYACRAFAVDESAPAKKDRERGRALLEGGDGLLQVFLDQTKGQDRAQINRALKISSTLQPFHWQLAYPEVFLGGRCGFDVVLGNPPWEEVIVEKLQFWSWFFPGLRRMTNAEQARFVARVERTREDLSERLEALVTETNAQRKVLASGAFPGMGRGDPDLYKAFVWRFWQTCRVEGAVGIVTPRSLYTTLGAADWRKTVLPLAITDLTFLRNKDEWIFEGVNPAYDVAMSAMKRLGDSQLNALTVRGTFSSRSEYDDGIDSRGVALDVAQLEQLDPEALAIPTLDNPEEFVLFQLLTRHPGIEGATRSDFDLAPFREFDVTLDGRELFTGKDSDFPIFNHLNIGHFNFCARSRCLCKC